MTILSKQARIRIEERGWALYGRMKRGLHFEIRPCPLFILFLRGSSGTKENAYFTLETFPEAVLRVAQAVLVVYPFEYVKSPAQVQRITVVQAEKRLWSVSKNPIQSRLFLYSHDGPVVQRS